MNIEKTKLENIFEDKESLIELLVSHKDGDTYECSDAGYDEQSLEALNIFIKKIEPIFKKVNKNSFAEVKSIIEERKIVASEYPNSPENGEQAEAQPIEVK